MMVWYVSRRLLEDMHNATSSVWRLHAYHGTFNRVSENPCSAEGQLDYCVKKMLLCLSDRLLPR